MNKADHGIGSWVQGSETTTLVIGAIEKERDHRVNTEKEVKIKKK